MNAICYLEHPSPVGPLRIAASSQGLVAVHMERQRHMPEAVDPAWKRATPADMQARATLHAACTQLDEYFAGRRRTFDLPLDARGTEFQKLVWSGLLAIGFGETSSYGELARRIGRDKAVRAVGLANGRNPLSIVVPCHRVIGADGSMTGYGGGLERKVFLLRHEARGATLAHRDASSRQLELV